jgi:ATP synthase protein I
LPGACLQAARKLKLKRSPGQSVWAGLGVSGIIGWGIVVPTLLGAGLGLWLDEHYASKHSWTLTMIFIGLAIGCLNAWHWVKSMYNDIQKGENNHE